jgi:hypothetical protein
MILTTLPSRQRLSDRKDDRYRRGSRLCGSCRGEASHDNYDHLTAHKICRQLRKSIVLTLGPAIFDRDVLTLDIAGFFQALPEGVTRRRQTPPTRRRETRHGPAGSLRAAGATAAPPSNVMNSRRFARSPLN